MAQIEFELRRPFTEQAKKNGLEIALGAATLRVNIPRYVIDSGYDVFRVVARFDAAPRWFGRALESEEWRDLTR